MKILIISQHLFPMQTPRAHRTTELVRELGKQGHDVTVYAVLGKYDYSEFENKFNVQIKDIRLKWMIHPYNSDNDQKRTLVDKILGRILKRLEFPNLEFIYRIPLILKADYKYDALITIADPHQIHWGAAKYRKKFPDKFPKTWIADCGDPFMMNGATKHLNFFEKLERLFCQQCDYITVPVEEAKKGYYLEYRNKIQVIPQGFEFDLNIEKSEPQNNVITFAYAGNFYKDIRNPESFIKYISSIKTPFNFIVFTPYTGLIKQYCSLLGDRIIVTPALPRSELIKELAKMDFLVNIENINSPAQIPSKLIDYAIAGRPILSINPSKLNTNIIDQFLAHDYSGQYKIENLEQFHITNVAHKFIKLINQ